MHYSMSVCGINSITSICSIIRYNELCAFTENSNKKKDFKYLDDELIYLRKQSVECWILGLNSVKGAGLPGVDAG